MKQAAIFPLAIVILIALILMPDLLARERTKTTSLIAGTLAVTVTGLRSDAGHVRLALVRNEAELYNDNALPYMGGIAAIVSSKATYRFNAVPYGTYAIKVYHDENDNERLDKEILGIPKEEYGFSMIPATKKGRPSFTEASFELNTPQRIIDIAVKK